MPSSDSTIADLDVVLRDNWGSGIVVDLSLTAEQSLSGWTIAFDYAGEIVNIWNAEIVSKVGNRYTVENVGYNGTLAAGASTMFGFQGSGSATDITPVSVNGAPFDGGAGGGDPQPVPTVSVSDATAAEEDGSITFTFTLSEAASKPVVVAYQTVPGSAQAVSDFVAAQSNVTFAAGQTSATVTIQLVDDASAEGAEQFELRLLSANGADIGTGSAVGRIMASDADPGGSGDPMLSVYGDIVTEGDPGDTVYVDFDITLDAPAAQALSFAYETQDGSATAGEDYAATSGTVSFDAGQQVATVRVAVTSDTIAEDTESFSLVLTEPSGAEKSGLGTILDDDAGDAGSGSGSGPFVGGGQTYYVGQTSLVTGFDATTDVLDLGPNSIHNQIPVDTPDGFMMLHMFNASQSLLLQGVHLADLHPENFAPIADSHLQQDLSAALAYEDGTGLVRPNTVYVRSHTQGLQEIVDFDPATDKVSFFYLSVRGDGGLNFTVEDTAQGARFYNPLSGQSLTLRGVSFSELDSSHFEWRANQLEDGIAGRMGLEGVIDGFTYPSENIFSGKSVAMAGLVDRAPYHSQPGYTGTPIGTGTDPGDGTGDGGTGGGGSAPVVVTVTGGSVTEADPGTAHVHDDGSSHVHDDGHRYITFQVALEAPASETLTLAYATEDGTAVADTTSDVAWDYHETTGTLVFAPGDQTKSVTVAVHPDTLVEETETFTFRVAGDNITGVLDATGTIVDNDVHEPHDDGTGHDDGSGHGNHDFVDITLLGIVPRQQRPHRPWRPRRRPDAHHDRGPARLQRLADLPGARGHHHRRCRHLGVRQRADQQHTGLER